MGGMRVCVCVCACVCAFEKARFEELKKVKVLKNGMSDWLTNFKRRSIRLRLFTP